jgi:hypothetical protein
VKVLMLKDKVPLLKEVLLMLKDFPPSLQVIFHILKVTVQKL